VGGVVQTVLGPVPSDQLGPTHPHEHLLVDFTGGSFQRRTTSTERARWDAPLTLANYFDARRHPMKYRQVQQLVDLDDAIHEAQLFKQAGGTCIVDQTPLDLARDPAGLQRISRAAGIHVVMGVGHYTSPWHSLELDSETEEQITERFVRDLTKGTEDGVQAGIIGEIGLSWPVHPNELKVLKAAVAAQRETGAPLSVHPGRDPQGPLDAAAKVEAAGGNLARTVICHIERTIFSVDEMERVLRTGCSIEFDMFGHESSFFPFAPIDMPNDATRIDYLLTLRDRGYLEQLLVSQDICWKVHTQRYGGEGYGHILTNIVPLMRRKGMRQEEIAQLLVTNPARVLTVS
jgi:phosphotriesterase-related protein